MNSSSCGYLEINTRHYVLLINEHNIAYKTCLHKKLYFQSDQLPRSNYKVKETEGREELNTRGMSSTKLKTVANVTCETTSFFQGIKLQEK